MGTREKQFRYSPPLHLLPMDVQQQLERAVTVELGIEPYEYKRDKKRYIEDLCGLEGFFRYVQLLGGGYVLDIGSGTTQAASELAKETADKGLEFRATGLVRHHVIASYLGFDRFHLASAELLEGIEDRSIRGALAVFSITYSSDPRLVVRSIDRVLQDGGALKTVFPHQKVKHYYNDIPIQTHHPFTENLRYLGYDIAVGSGKPGTEIMLAIKPGNPTPLTAETLLLLDEFIWKKHQVPNHQSLSIY